MSKHLDPATRTELAAMAKLWTEEAEKHEAMAAASMAKAAAFRRKVEGVSIVLEEKALIYPKALTPQQAQLLSQPNGVRIRATMKHTREQEPMTDAIIRTLAESERALGRKQIKKALKDAGYPESRLQNYFYTCLNRLVTKQRIVRRGDRYSALPSEPFPANAEAPSNAH